MQLTELGNTGVHVSAIGYGAMPLSLESRPPRETAIKILHGIFDLGITFIDTADCYCIDEEDKHYNEETIYAALSSYSGDTSAIRVATKGGIVRPNGRWDPSGEPTYLLRTIRESHRALGGKDPLFLWQHHVPDPNVAVSESLKAAKQAQEEGLVRYIGVSNYSKAQIEEALGVVELVSVQNQFNPWYRQAETDGVLEYCDSNGITFIPWSPFGGMGRAKSLSQIDVVQDTASAKGVTPQQIVLAWIMSKSKRILPIPGASRIESIADCLHALDVSLSEQQIKKLNSAL